MHRTLLLLVLAGLAVAGCDQQDPTSAEDFDVQPAVTLSTAGLEFTAGQTPPATFTVRYQGLDAAPEAAGPAGVTFELLDETGTPQSGTRTWAVGFDGPVPSAGSVDAAVTVRAASGGRDILKSVALKVNSPVSISESFRRRLAVVEDYEGDARSVTTTGGTTVEVVTGADVSPNSNGIRALRIDATESGSVVFNRTVNAPGQGIFSFILKSAADFTLTVTFRDQAGADVRTFDVAVPVTGGPTYRRYSIAATQLFDGFSPVAERSGGDGPLVAVAMSASAPATFFVDDLAFGTSDGPTIEVNDFETPSNPYNCGLATADVTATSTMVDGVTARRFTFNNGGDCFGYNFQNDGPALFLDAGSGGALSLVVGQVPKAFNLYVFVETAGGAYSFGSGREVPIEAGDAFREVRIPLTDLGTPVGALANPGITNVGFSVRRQASDTTTDPISFVLDDVKLVARN